MNPSLSTYLRGRTHWLGLACIAMLSACQTVPTATRPAPATPEPSVAAAKPRSGKPKRPPTPPAPVLLQDEPGPPTDGGAVFDRLVARFADTPCVVDPLVQRWQKLYAGSPRRFAAQIDNVLPLMSMALEEAERYRLPGELVLLPIVESWYRPDAGAGSGHVGLWQFGAPTARGLGLAVRNDYDARMAPFAATDAAFRHLAALHNEFGDWKLANMAYNAGPYRLGKLIRDKENVRVSASGRQPPGLSPVTYEHIAKVQALACLLARPDAAGIELPRDTPIAPLTTVTLPPGASTLNAIAAAVQIDADELRRLNPAFRRGIVSAQADRELLVPRASADRFTAFRLPVVAPSATALVASADGSSQHVVRSGDTLGAIARHYGVQLRDLLAWNDLSSRSVLRLGQRIRLAPCTGTAAALAAHYDSFLDAGVPRRRCLDAVPRRPPEACMGFLQGKRALIVGIASQRSIASGIAEAMHREGAELAFTYQNEKLKSRVEDAAAECGSKIVLPLDVADDAQIANVFEQLGQHWDGFDILVHSVGFAPREALEGGFLDNLTRENFAIAHDISAYSLAALAKAGRPMMQARNGSILTLSYLGAERALANYNVMGLAKASLEACVRYLALNLGPEGTRVNAISAGPIKTLAAAGIGNFRKMLGHVEEHAPLRRSVTIEDVGNVAAFLCSDLAAGVTGEITYVDAGYNILGMTGIG